MLANLFTWPSSMPHHSVPGRNVWTRCPHSEHHGSIATLCLALHVPCDMCHQLHYSVLWHLVVYCYCESVRAAIVVCGWGRETYTHIYTYLYTFVPSLYWVCVSVEWWPASSPCVPLVTIYPPLYTHYLLSTPQYLLSTLQYLLSTPQYLLSTLHSPPVVIVVSPSYPRTTWARPTLFILATSDHNTNECHTSPS